MRGMAGSQTTVHQVLDDASPDVSHWVNRNGSNLLQL